MINTSLFLDKTLKKCRIYKNSDNNWMISLYDIFDIYVEIICRNEISNDIINQVIKTVTREVFLESLFQRFKFTLSRLFESLLSTKDLYRYTSFNSMDVDEGGDTFDYCRWLLPTLNKITNLYSGFIYVLNTEHIIHILAAYTSIYICKNNSDIVENFHKPEYLVVIIRYLCTSGFSDSSSCVHWKDSEKRIKNFNENGYVRFLDQQSDIIHELNVMKLTSLHLVNEYRYFDEEHWNRNYQISISLYKLINMKSTKMNKKLQNLEIKYKNLNESNVLTDKDIHKIIIDKLSDNMRDYNETIHRICDMKTSDIKDQLIKHQNDTKNKIFYMYIYIIVITVLFLMK